MLGLPDHKPESAFLSPRVPSRRDEEKLAKLKAITGPFMLRRLKSDRSIIKDLPDKVPVHVLVYMYSVRMYSCTHVLMCSYTQLALIREICS
jgi:SNF2 family DNA or RNA helicase